MEKKKSRFTKIFQSINNTYFCFIIIICLIIIFFLSNNTKKQQKKEKELINSQNKIQLKISNNQQKVNTINNDINSLNNIDNLIKKEYNLYLQNVTKLDTLVNEKKVDAKIAYLTFDDGPTPLTSQFLDVLKENDVLATFFVLGYNRENYLEEYRRIINEGHTIANHTYSHNFNYIYSSVKNLMNDINMLNDFLFKNFKIKPSFIRFPGGSMTAKVRGNFNEMKKELFQQGYGYIDWNVSSGDGGGVKETVLETVNYVINGSSNKNISIILMHDYNENTLNALPLIIKELRNKGYELLPLVSGSSMIEYE